METRGDKSLSVKKRKDDGDWTGEQALEEERIEPGFLSNTLVSFN